LSIANPDASADPTTTRPAGGAYAWYVLGVLVLVYVLNFVDRQILAILAEAIKADLGITDADLGFLFGTAFAVFYAVLGIPLARLADVWNRKQLISIGLAFWSLMTTLSGLARSFVPLAICRFGVGAGEASASPAAYSLLYDHFPARVRTTVLSLYSTGVFIGQGIGLFLGGALLAAWTRAYPDPALAPFGFKGWQAAFMIVGVPGLLMSLWVATLREPVRGVGDGLPTALHPHPFRETLAVLASILPLSNLWVLRGAGARGSTIAANLAAGVTLAVAATWLTKITGNAQQWAALAVAVYAIVSWVQGLAVRDSRCFAIMFGSRALLWTVFGAAATNFMLSALGFWSVPFYQRYYGLTAAQVGPMIGLATGGMGLIGVVLGGLCADRLRLRTRNGKLIVVLASLVGSLLSALLLLNAPRLELAYAGSFGLMLLSSAGLGPCVSTLNDLVLPRMRATSSAFGFMVTYLIAGALGPYLIGRLSDEYVRGGAAQGEALRMAMHWGLVVPLAGIACMIFAMRHLAREESGLLRRAQALGEPL
jgi:MFS family permease